MRPLPFVLGILGILHSTGCSQSPTEEALLERLLKGPDSSSALDTVLKKPDEYSALILYAGAGVAFKENRLEDSGFLYYSAQLRARFDKECFPPKGTGGNSPFVVYAALSQQLGSEINPAVMAEPKVFEKALARLKEFIPKAPQNYDPGYEFLEKKSAQNAFKAVEPNRTEFINRMTDLSTLLNDAEYFAAFQVIQEYNLSRDGKRPTAGENDKATETMKRIEKTKGLEGFFSEEEHHNVDGGRYHKIDGEWSYEGRVIKEAHSATFQLLSGAEFAKDRARVYVRGFVVPEADPQTFTVIKGPYGKDKKKVYCGTVAMNVHDIDAFEVVSWEGMWNTTFDKQLFVFDFGRSFETLQISEENPAVTGFAVGRDGVAYYSGPARIEGADYASFQAGSMGGGVDKYREYVGPFPAESWPQRRKDILGHD